MKKERTGRKRKRKRRRLMMTTLLEGAARTMARSRRTSNKT
jgi:hypothetical protein